MLTTAAGTGYDALAFDAKQQAAAIASDAFLTGIQRRQGIVDIIVTREFFLLLVNAGAAGDLLQQIVVQLILLFGHDGFLLHPQSLIPGSPARSCWSSFHSRFE